MSDPERTVVIPRDRLAYPRPVSPEIADLSHGVPFLFSPPRPHGEGTPILDTATPMNWTGAIFLELDRRVAVREIDRGYMELATSDDLRPFTQVFPRVEVHLGNLDIEAAILTTSAYNNPEDERPLQPLASGVVLSGPYAGLIWEGDTLRVFPDRRVDLGRLPRIPSALIENSSFDRFLRRYKEYVRALQEVGGGLYYTDLFFNLIEHLGVSVDMEGFHFTRSVKEHPFVQIADQLEED